MPAERRNLRCRPQIVGVIRDLDSGCVGPDAAFTLARCRLPMVSAGRHLPVPLPAGRRVDKGEPQSYQPQEKVSPRAPTARVGRDRTARSPAACEAHRRARQRCRIRPVVRRDDDARAEAPAGRRTSRRQLEQRSQGEVVPPALAEGSAPPIRIVILAGRAQRTARLQLIREPALPCRRCRRRRARSGVLGADDYAFPETIAAVGSGGERADAGDTPRRGTGRLQDQPRRRASARGWHPPSVEPSAPTCSTAPSRRR